MRHEGRRAAAQERAVRRGDTCGSGVRTATSGTGVRATTGDALSGLSSRSGNAVRLRSESAADATGIPGSRWLRSDADLYPGTLRADFG